jgi:hypothetical protein
MEMPENTSNHNLPKWKQEDQIRFKHAPLNEIAGILSEFYLERVRRDVDDGRLTPLNYWVLIRGLLAAGWQTYRGICQLIAERQPKPFTLQAGILNRSLFEILATVLALSEKPERARILERESVRSMGREYQRLFNRFRDVPKWEDYLNVFRAHQEASLAKIGAPEGSLGDPNLIIGAEWPTPGTMLWGSKRKKLPPFVSGSRHAVLRELYESHYGHQSAQAHARMAAVAVAFMADHPEEEWNPGAAESNLVIFAMLCLACMFSEIDASAGYSHQKLVELWVYLRESHDDAKELWNTRYMSLLST